MKRELRDEVGRIERSIALARREKPVYSEWYPLLEPLFLLQARVKESLSLKLPEIPVEHVKAKWQEGFPLLHRWDFPIDLKGAEEILEGMGSSIPEGNPSLRSAHAVFVESLAEHPDDREKIWRSFLHHEWEPWDEWIRTEDIDIASLLFWGRSALRPSLEWVAEELLDRFQVPDTWFKGYCPVCGSLPALVYLHGQGDRRAYCSWCGSEWGLHRFQCPNCDNRLHESLGYMVAEEEPLYRIQYCRLCKAYFKLVDLRERSDPAYFPLEEWTTLHLDLLAQNAGWKQAPSPSPIVYGDSNA